MLRESSLKIGVYVRMRMIMLWLRFLDVRVCLAAGEIFSYSLFIIVVVYSLYCCYYLCCCVLTRSCSRWVPHFPQYSVVTLVSLAQVGPWCRWLWPLTLGYSECSTMYVRINHTDENSTMLVPLIEILVVSVVGTPDGLGEFIAITPLIYNRLLSNIISFFIYECWILWKIIRPRPSKVKYEVANVMICNYPKPPGYDWNSVSWVKINMFL